ncbi:Protein GrpE [Gracilariopsis chorda]|uniref:Protein GrpE n=1 Tax=Gracilariopsis chorda TaxID=448386 RepID=A0A2V3J0N7_9FLOR|nr:Protein GrpE [Gracilariopsis chorda]|eukprot:PXF47895.1 Protein GrpE [Gracilariopsis chorda]
MLRSVSAARHILRNVYCRNTYLRPPVNLAASRFYATQDKQVNEDDPEARPSPPNEENGKEQQNTISDANNMRDLIKQLEEKETELADLNDRTLRVLAEMENVRMIARRDVENARKYAVVPFAQALLSVADNLGLALKSVPEDALNAGDAQPHLKGLYTGLGATESELLKVFAQHGIERFGAVGDKFDPNKYQAMFEVPSPDHEPGTVIDVTKLGYTIGDRILRPAEVGVSRAQ